MLYWLVGWLAGLLLSMTRLGGTDIFFLFIQFVLLRTT